MPKHIRRPGDSGPPQPNPTTPAQLAARAKNLERDDLSHAALEARERAWRGRPEWEIRAEMEAAIARRFAPRAAPKRPGWPRIASKFRHAITAALVVIALLGAPVRAQEPCDPAVCGPNYPHQAEITVTWAPLSDPAIDGYRVRLDGAVVADVPGPPWQIVVQDYLPHLVSVSAVDWTVTSGAAVGWLPADAVLVVARERAPLLSFPYQQGSSAPVALPPSSLRIIAGK